MSDSVRQHDCQCWCGAQITNLTMDGVWQAERFLIGKCSNCGTLSTLEVTSNVFLPENYIYEKLSPRHFESIKTIEKYIIGNMNTSSSSILEIGCNTGAFLRLLKSRYIFRDLIGQDYNQQAIELNSDDEIFLSNKPLNQFTGNFQLIILMHVLEHIRDLGDIVSEINRITAINSFLYIAVPNIDSYNFKKSGVKWGALNPVDHKWHFSKKSLKRFVTEFLPGWKITYLGSSWIWPSRFIPINWLAEGDQLELILKRVGSVEKN